MTEISSLILSQLLYNDNFYRKVYPYIQADYFQDRSERHFFEEYSRYLDKYYKVPTNEALVISYQKREDIDDESIEAFNRNLEDFKKQKNVEHQLDWLVDEAEKFCQERSLYNALVKAYEISSDDTKKSKNEIPDILQKALAVSFDANLGHDYFEDSDKRFEKLHEQVSKIPFMHNILNDVTNGGFETKTLNMIMAPSGVGKSIFLCDVAAGCLKAGMNVLYISLEMSEEKIAERIDASLIDMPLDDLRDLPKAMYDKHMDRLKSLYKGKLKIKEYPAASAHVNHFRHLLHECKMKEGFKPSVILIDYLNICLSARFKTDQAMNMYQYYKSVAEEFRGLAVEEEVAIWSATQTNRDAYGSTDYDAGNTSESMGIMHTLDFFMGLIPITELEERKQILAKQLKNRYGDLNWKTKFIIGLDRARMKFYELSEDEARVTTTTDRSERITERPESEFSKPSNKKKVSGLKV